MQRTSDEIPQRGHNEDRMRRAESWLSRAQRTTTAGREIDETGLAWERFMFLWVSFNAAYGYDLLDEQSLASRPQERQKYEAFLSAIVERDKEESIYNILWNEYPGPVRVLLDNKYVYQPFWEAVRGSSDGRGWSRWFRADKEKSFRALRRGDVVTLLHIVFWRLYALRNQVFHGGTTFAEGWGSDQIRDGSRIMAALVPAILDIMRADIAADPDTDAWGKVAWPRVNERKD